MLSASVFMLVWGGKLAMETMGQTLAELPWLAVGYTYLPVPLSGLITLIFVLEQMFCGHQHDSATSTFDHTVEEGSA